MGSVASIADSIEQIALSRHNVDSDDVSDNLVEQVAELSDLLLAGNLGEVYAAWRNCSWADGFDAGVGLWEEYDEYALFPELYNLHWGKIAYLRNILKDMGEIGSELGDAFNAARAGLDTDGGWQGVGADAAYERIDRVVRDAGEYQDVNSALAGALDGYLEVMREAIGDLVNQRPTEMLDKYRRDSDGYWDLKNTYQEVIEESQKDSDYKYLPDPLAWLAGGETRREEYEEEIANLNIFARHYVNAVQYLREMLPATVDALDASAGELQEALSEFRHDDVPFARLTQPEPTASGNGRSVASGPGAGPGSGARGPAPSAGGGGGAGIASPPGGAGNPDSPQMDRPGVTPQGHTSPSAAVPDGVETDTGPGVGQGGIGGSLPSEEWGGDDALTVTKGSHELSMTEVGESGRMSISVDDGRGEPREHFLDFANGDIATAGPGAPGVDGDLIDGDHDALTPGEDGVIEFESGELTVTAERPDGAGGPVEVTVDDGSGEPTTYTLESSGDGSGDLPGQAWPNEPVAGTDEPIGAGIAGLDEPGGGVGAGVAGGAGGGALGGDLGGIAGGASSGAGIASTAELGSGSQAGAAMPPETGTPGSGSPAAGEPGGGSGQGQQSGHGRMMGGGMMGGMGGAGGGGGGDQQHERQYQIGGIEGLFEDLELDSGAARISGIIGDDADLDSEN
ncbi:hypothetical protein SAMN06265360_115140 [Haloechinothrix alba]|uniref:Proteins of 100 residues with WXG n=1 Tax=Haloechinothrix alba TaxID=664784 RepID=A0A238YLK8_9PSEU|nr:hypothetical protein [Haloechinothrix alba]SNR71514.1 hypothetical protein SAMN06265360_115140 [Haloechinothrix alba]